VQSSIHTDCGYTPLSRGVPGRVTETTLILIPWRQSFTAQANSAITESVSGVELRRLVFSFIMQAIMCPKNSKNGPRLKPRDRPGNRPKAVALGGLQSKTA